MGFAERLSSACVTSDLKSVEEKIKPVEHVAALSGATSIGSDMFRARDHDISALRRAILLLARKARNELHIGMEPSQQLATAAMTGADSAYAASSTKKKKSSGTSADRAELMEIARQVCRKKYGAGSTVYRLDYTRKRVVCVPPGY